MLLLSNGLLGVFNYPSGLYCRERKVEANVVRNCGNLDCLQSQESVYPWVQTGRAKVFLHTVLYWVNYLSTKCTLHRTHPTKTKLNQVDTRLNSIEPLTASCHPLFFSLWEENHKNNLLITEEKFLFFFNSVPR